MQISRFRAWLERQEKRGGGPYNSRTIGQYISDAKAVEEVVERVYGRNLDGLYAKDCLAEILQELECVAEARKSDGPNRYGLYGPGYKNSVNAYRKFCDWAAGRADAREFGDGG